jgi:hypothetical protein
MTQTRALIFMVGPNGPNSHRQKLMQESAQGLARSEELPARPCGFDLRERLFSRQTLTRDRHRRKCLRISSWRALQDSNLRPPGS